MKEFCSVDISDEILEPENPIAVNLEQQYLISDAQLIQSDHTISSNESEADTFLNFYASFIGAKAADRLAWRTESFKSSGDA
jgi:hypothetical protein